MSIAIVTNFRYKTSSDNCTNTTGSSVGTTILDLLSAGEHENALKLTLAQHTGDKNEHLADAIPIINALFL